jgi:hypothetical protein
VHLVGFTIEIYYDARSSERQIQKLLFFTTANSNIYVFLHNNTLLYNKINGTIRRHFGKKMTKETKLRIHNIRAKAALKFGSEVWVLKKIDKQRLETAQMKIFRHLLGITK